MTLYFILMTPKKIPWANVKHQAITLDDKLSMLKRHEKGEKVISIVRSFWNESDNCIHVRDVN